MRAKYIIPFVTMVLAGCSASSGTDVQTVGLEADTPLPQRHGTVIVSSCTLDTWQWATLADPATKRVVQEVVMLCLVPRVDGTVGPRDPSALAQLANLSQELHAQGYQFDLALSFTDETGERYDGAQQAKFLADPKWRAQLVSTLVPHLADADGIDMDFGGLLPADARDSLTALVTEVANVVRPAKKLALHVPPSITNPSDLPGGEAFSRPELARVADRFRLMTLDYTLAMPGGPTTDPGWAVDAARLALADSPTGIDVSYPLYGTDFSPQGSRSVTYLEAMGTAWSSGAAIQHGPTGVPFFRYTSPEGQPHAIWFDDAESTGLALGAWKLDTLPAGVGVTFYGLGAEDPTLFQRIAARTQ
ncbi:MAG TPA: hypothetical protein VIF62_16145 [Labilithrix sp.]